MPEISETIVVALVSAGAALLGAVLGILGTQMNVKMQMKTAVLSAVLPARLSAYHSVEVALEEWSSTLSKESYAAVYRAFNAAVLVGSPQVSQSLGKLQSLLRDAETSGVLPDKTEMVRRHRDVLLDMNYDLYHISLPEIDFRGGKADKQKDKQK